MKQLKFLTWVFIIISVSVCSCDSSKDEPTPTEVPKLTTTQITGIANTAAVSGGSISSEGSSTVTARGVCWSTNENPTTANSKTTDASGSGTFTSNLTGLTANTKYYVRAYATSTAGTAYGNQESFTTTNIPAAGTIREFIVDITHVRDGSSRMTSNGTGPCLFVDGVVFDKDPYAKSYTVLFYDMTRTVAGQTTTYPANTTYTFNANAGNELLNGTVGTDTYYNWYNAGTLGAVTKLSSINKLHVMANWCTTMNCIDNCWWVNGKARVTVHY